jgi:hypothetical protein
MAEAEQGLRSWRVGRVRCSVVAFGVPLLIAVLFLPAPIYTPSVSWAEAALTAVVAFLAMCFLLFPDFGLLVLRGGSLTATRDGLALHLPRLDRLIRRAEIETASAFG